MISSQLAQLLQPSSSQPSWFLMQTTSGESLVLLLQRRIRMVFQKLHLLRPQMPFLSASLYSSLFSGDSFRDSGLLYLSISFFCSLAKILAYSPTAGSNGVSASTRAMASLSSFQDSAKSRQSWMVASITLSLALMAGSLVSLCCRFSSKALPFLTQYQYLSLSYTYKATSLRDLLTLTSSSSMESLISATLFSSCQISESSFYLACQSSLLVTELHQRVRTEKRYLFCSYHFLFSPCFSISVNSFSLSSKSFSASLISPFLNLTQPLSLVFLARLQMSSSSSISIALVRSQSAFRQSYFCRLISAFLEWMLNTFRHVSLSFRSSCRVISSRDFCPFFSASSIQPLYFCTLASLKQLLASCLFRPILSKQQSLASSNSLAMRCTSPWSSISPISRVQYWQLTRMSLQSGLRQSLGFESRSKIEPYSRWMQTQAPVLSTAVTLQMFSALKRIYYSLTNSLLANWFSFMSTNPWSQRSHLVAIYLYFTEITKMQPSWSANFLALSRLLEVDMKPYIYMNTPGCMVLKSLILSLAPLQSVMAGILRVRSCRNCRQKCLTEWQVSWKGRMQVLNSSVVLRVLSIELRTWQQKDSLTQNLMICSACSLVLIWSRCLIFPQSIMFSLYFSTLPYFYRTSIMKFTNAIFLSFQSILMAPQRLERQSVASVLSLPERRRKLGNFICFMVAYNPLLYLYI